MRQASSVLTTAAISVFALKTAALAVPAFPGATGPGAIATGGRGGDVYHVTTLDPDKAGVVPGSFMYGARTAPGAGRTIVFDVGGTIYLAGGTSNDDTLRFNWGNITVAGQTAPGPGITIAGTGRKWTGTNVILRNISVRPNKSAQPATVTYDSFSLQVKNSIVDHVSATWFTDEGISITDAGANSTVQYANISEGLHYNGHSFGSIISTEVDGTKYAYHHNLYAHLASRMPAVGSETGVTGATTEFSNNVLYNWSSTKVGYGALTQPSSTNFIRNYYINGYNSAVTNLFVADTSTKIHQTGNFLDRDRDAVLDGTVIASGSAGSTYFRSGDSSAPLTYVNTPFDVPGAGVNTRETAGVALQRVVDFGGANWWARSPIDARIYNDVRNQTGRNITDLTAATQAAEWNTLMAQRTAVSRPAGYDTDRDGMPDAWEVLYGLNPGVADHNADFDTDGYTNLEEYINEVAAWPAPKPLVYTGGASGRFALSANWDIDWQPSRFDTVQVNTGIAHVDAMGQTAMHVHIGAVAGTAPELRVTNGRLVVGGDVEVGKIAGSTSAALQLSGGKLVVAGTMKSGAGATPRLELTGGTLVANQIIAAGFSGGVVNAGARIAPGDAGVIGKTTVTGAFAQTSGTLAIELGGTTPATAFQQLTAGFDVLSVTGTATFGGSLELSRLNGYDPAWLVPHRIVNASSVTGQFSSIAGVQVSNGKSLAVVYDATGALAIATLPGDANVDGTVNFDDLLMLAASYNQPNATWSRGDFNCTGTTDFDDLLLMASNYNTSIGPGAWALASVPEPMALASGLLAAALALTRRVR